MALSCLLSVPDPLKEDIDERTLRKGGPGVKYPNDWRETLCIYKMEASSPRKHHGEDINQCAKISVTAMHPHAIWVAPPFLELKYTPLFVVKENQQ